MRKRRTKKMKNELLIVAYIGVKDLDLNETYEALTRGAEALTEFVKDSGKCCVIPSYETTGVRVECINPTFISDKELREETKKKVDRLIAEFEKNYNINEKGN